MLIYKDGVVGDYRELFYNVSFPDSGPDDEFLAEQGAVRVNLFKPHNSDTQKLVPCDPYIEDGWAYTVEVQDKTAEEVAADTASKAMQARAKRDEILKRSDWMVIRAQETGTTIDAEWATYRQALRDVTEQDGFPLTIEWPIDPDEAARKQGE